MEASKRCFISAGNTANLARFHRAVKAAGWLSFDLSDTAQPGSSLLESLVDAVRESDLVLACLSSRTTNNVAFEAGLAYALGKTVVVVASPRMTIPASMTSFLTVRATSRNPWPIVETLSGLLVKPRRARSSGRIPPSGKALGTYAIELLREVDHAKNESDVEVILLRALNQSDVIAVSAQKSERGFDIGIWSDDLDSIGGNPMGIEVKREISAAAYAQVASYLQPSSTRMALIVYLDEAKEWLQPRAPSILAISLRTLLSRMAQRSFAEVVVGLRNEYAHDTAVPSQ